MRGLQTNTDSMPFSGQLPQKIAILGCGLMGTALLQGWLRQPQPKHTFSAYVRTEPSLGRLQNAVIPLDHEHRVRYWIGSEQILHCVADADIVVLAFLPKALQQVMQTPGLTDSLRDKTVVSVLAGVSLASLRAHVFPGEKNDVRVARVIPTLAAKVGESVTLIAEGEGEAAGVVRQIFSVVGSSIDVPEGLMDEATAIGATVNALAIVAVDSITDASVAEGVPRATAQALVAESLRSVCGLMLKGEMTPESVKASMSTPGGITLNAVVDLDAGARAGVAAATRGAIRYAKRMND